MKINGIPIEFYNSLEYPDWWQYKPDGDMRRCQCVMGHYDMHEGSIPQCGGQRSPGSDLYCYGCEEIHGKAYTAALAEKEQRERR